MSTPGGWADVYVDGARQGRTPIRIDVPVGRHQVELRIFGRRAESRSVDVREGVVSRLVLPVADQE